MQRGGGTLLIVAISWFYVFASFYKLWQNRFYARFFTVLIVFSLVGLLLYFGFVWSWSLETGSLRVWAVSPFVLLVIVYFLSGFFLQKHVESFIQKRNHAATERRQRTNSRIRLIGVMLFLAGIGAWVYGIVQPISGAMYIYALILSLCCMIFGLPYLLTGKRIRDIDS